MNIMETKNKQISIIIFCSAINKIGGIETWIYYMSQRLCRYYDITLLFDDAYINQLERLSKYIKIEHRNENKQYKCDVLLMASNWRPVPLNIKYNKIVQTIHSDYEYLKNKMGYSFNIPQNAEVISVSPRTQEALRLINKCDSKIIYNILGEKQKTNKVLHLVTFSRMSVEKGFGRMCFLIEKLKKNNIKFDWKIFATIDENNKNQINCPEVIFMPPTLDIYDYIVDADYLVQLSDTEAFCYSVHEAFQYGTPVIVTDIPAFKEFVIDGYNGYLVNLNMSNVTDEWIDNLIHNIPNDFTYIEPCNIQQWFEVLGEPYENNDNADVVEYNNQDIEIEAINDYTDLIQHKHINVGDKYKVDKLRAYELTSKHNNSNMILAKYCETTWR